MKICPRAVAELAIATSAASASISFAEVTTYTERHAWENAVGAIDEIDFTGIPSGTPLDTQYAQQGVFFGGNYDFAVTSAVFLDLSGATSPQNIISVTFLSATRAVAFDVPPQHLAIGLYRGSSYLGAVSHNAEGFFGLSSTVEFDRIHVHANSTHVLVDNLFWPMVPSPSGVAILSGGMLFGAALRRRR